MIHLNQTPIFLEFLTFNLKISKETIANNFYISKRCNCNQTDCATVILKKRKNSPINEENLQIDIQNSKGFIHFHWYDDELDIEAIYYKFPFRYEINRVFPKSGRLGKIIPKKAKKKKIKASDRQNLKRFLNNKMSPYEEKRLYRSDYRAWRDGKLFAHVR